eukprot:gnl/TRDRNA2_/TRDRNA2_42442_c0_seq1.p1 gnl/TRDRNA2_/TRDRNA2_42442_c0~~gnl/TRDRNA2_/TRDRNA2_42442_c0_seq1.p1  ORF type:complete len:456 (+),score=95.19 gnl/TRDRNA2_/TRDRNA2_42442_c0_seq1:68-1435(+)
MGNKRRDKTKKEGGEGSTVEAKQKRPAAAQKPYWRPARGGSGQDTAAAAGYVANPAPAAARAASQPLHIAGSFIPPGCDASFDDGCDDGEGAGQMRCYEESLVRGFWCPPRLRGRNESLIEAVNDWHFAMLNDEHRNQFYWKAMEDRVKGKRVIDIGAGSGLLSLMAAKLGSAKVLAIEASKDMVELAGLNTKRNGQDGIVRIIHSLSSSVRLKEEDKADIIVSETLGALMLGEGMLDYLADARKRLAKPDAAVIPAGGAQYAVLISSTSLAMVSSVQAQSHGFDLSAIGSLQDTGNLFFTKQWGFRLNSMPDVKNMSARICILEVDFHATERGLIPPSKTFRLEALHDGVIHAVVASWEVWSDKQKTHRITTHPEDTKDEPWGFARDMQWGQGLQLVEDYDAAQKSDRNDAPRPFTVKAGEPLLLTVRFSQPCRQTFQFTLRRELPCDGGDKKA